ncbi:MAG: Dabb family protein [Eudoraea sp.]|nr:Dabb family protein [Eudoraea sp.]
MKKRYAIITLFLIVALTSFKNNDFKKEQTTTKEVTMTDSVLRHVVLFKFKEGTSKDQLHEYETAFVALKNKIPEIVSFEWGLNNSPEGLEKGFTHCFFVTFSSEEDREIYLPHPDHQAFVSLIGPSVDDVLVVDYWTQ